MQKLTKDVRNQRYFDFGDVILHNCINWFEFGLKNSIFWKLREFEREFAGPAAGVAGVAGIAGIAGPAQNSRNDGAPAKGE